MAAQATKANMPVVLLKDGAEQSKGRDAQKNNIAAAKIIAVFNDKRVSSLPLPLSIRQALTPATKKALVRREAVNICAIR